MKYLQKTLAIILCFVTVFTAVPLTGRAVDDQEQSTLNQENIQVQSNNTLGKEIGELMEEQQETENSDYCISWMDLEGKTATVEMVNKLACTVVVAVFEENGKMVGSGKTEVEAETAEATVELDIETMPEYFVAKAFLLDENMASLCDEYLCERYTRDFQEFLDLTIHDFEDQIVVQLDDEEEDNNFVVAKDGTQESKQDGEKNILVSADDENGIYVFENADKTITGVSVGENLFYDLGDDNYILVKVASNVTEGNLTTVVADDADIGDLYDCVKIDTTADASQAVVDTSTMHESLEMVEPAPQLRKRAIDVEAERKFQRGFIVKYENKNESFKISGGFDFEAGVSMKLYYKVRLFKKDKVDFKVEAKYGYGYKIDVTAGMNSAVKLPLPKISIPIYAGIFFNIEMSFNFSAEGTIGIEGRKNVTCGFTYDNANGRRKIYEETENWVPSSKGLSFEVNVGLEIKGAISALQVVEAGIVVGIGIGLEGKFKKVDNKEGADKFHLCSNCCTGECFLFANLKITMNLGYKKLKLNIFNATVLERKYKLFDFYFSNISQGIFATCPHYLCKVTYDVTDNAGNKLKDIAIGDLRTDEDGSCYSYYEPNQSFAINLNVDGYLPYSGTVNVGETAVTMPIKLTPIKMTGISIKSLPTKTNYYTGDTLDTSGLTLTATYNSGKTETITSGFTCSPTTLNKAGTQAVTVTYNGFTTKFNVSVTQTKATSLSVVTMPNKVSYFVGDTLDTTGLVLSEKYNNGDVKTITSGYTCTPTILDTAGTQTITVKYGNNTCTYTVDVTPVVATGVVVSTLPEKLSYFVGDTLDTSGLVLTESYNNGKTVMVTSGYTCTPTTLDTAGTQTVTVTYGGHSCTFDVVVTPVIATEIIVSQMPSKLTYYTGDTLDTSGLVLTEVYNNGDTVTVTSGYTCTPTTLDTAGTQTVTVTYGENTCTFDITVIQLAPISITVETLPTKVIYFTGDTLDTTGFVLKVIYNNGDVKSVTSGYTCTPETLSIAGTQTITVTYVNKTCTFDISVYDAGECSGTCGANLIWTFEPLTGLLTIKGTGDMDLWNSQSSVPWYEYHQDIKTVKIEDGVTTIGNYAFRGCDNLTTVTIPNSVVIIGQEAFSSCDSLSSVTIGKSVSSICYGAFSHCNSITSIVLPDSLIDIGVHAFLSCKNLTSITIPDSVTSIGSRAFDLTGYYNDPNNWENEVLYIGSYLIYAEKTKSNEYVVKEGTRVIASYAFEGCIDMTSIMIPDSVTNIGSYAFYNCTGLVNISIGKGVTNIGEYAFYCCNSSSGIVVDERNRYYSNDEHGVLFDKDKTILIQYPVGSTRTSYTIPNGVISINKSAFYDCNDLINIVLSDSIINIGESAFYDCDSLTSMVLPDNVINIGNRAFYSCSNLESLSIGNKVTSIGGEAFSLCKKIASVKIPDSVTSIGFSAFYCCEGIENVEIGNSVTSIGNFAFECCFSLTSVTIPDSVTTLGEAAFYCCTGLTSVTIGNGITSIGYNVFSGCESLTNLIIPNSVTSIFNGAFAGCESLTSITVPDSVTSIGDSAFQYCSSISDVYYSGTEEQWKAISIGSFNGYLSSATIHYNSTGPASASMSLRTIKPPIEGVPVNLSVITAQTSGAIVGNRYTLIALDQTDTEYDLNNLAFIDHTLATGTDVSFSFMPKSAENLIVLIIGDFGSGVEQRVISGAPGVAVTGISLSHTSLEFYPGQDAVQLTAYITPDEASIKDVIWTSSDESVASVDKNGVVTPYNPGTATITATSASDGISAECQVTVTARTFEIKWIMSDGTHTVEYDESEAITEYENTDRTGYTFVGWDKTVPNRMPASNLEFKALYKANSYNATFDANGGQWADGTTVAKSVVADFDSDIPAQTEPTMQGFVFSGWEYNGENLGTNVGKMTSVDGMTFIAVWVPANDTRYTVKTYTMNENGEYILSEKVLSGTTNETATVSPEIENGFELNESKSVLSGKISADNSLVLSVYIDRKTYTFTTVVDGEETSIDYLYGAKIETPVAAEKPGYKFVKWNGAIPSTMPAENLTFIAVYERVINGFEIKQPSTTAVNYGDTLVISANLNGAELPEGWTVKWTIEGDGFNMATEDNGTTCKLTSVAKGNATVKATLIDENGNVAIDESGNEMSDSIQITSKAGFFQKLISFFKNLFGVSRIVY